MKSIVEIVDHYASLCEAPRFRNGHFKWKLRQKFLQLLEDTGGLPRALKQLLYFCFNYFNEDAAEFFAEEKEQSYGDIFRRVKNALNDSYNIKNLVGEKKECFVLRFYWNPSDFQTNPS
ncbi:hypothetical protein BC937DRAFT_95586 [Endogone sp. FLAS-F59071]|nr:hypothetical protein BC937DRAFT_95586 [Endogone sp. FLAS-F59071]|eukprot:RUS20259.1 hypothetical protein BC937DRAFT_95586 [Endogone sp. FLAS-F59071]